ncbi:MAG: ABC transporter permease [Sporolactobacillus sp.]
MNFSTLVKTAFRNIFANKLRTLLTTLGIVIGVASVIALLAIGQGSGQSITNSVNSLGTNLITVAITDTETHFTIDKLNEVKSVYGVKSVSPIVSGRETIQNGSTSTQASLIGTTPAYLGIRGLSVANGRFVSDIDDQYRQKVVVLGSDMASTLFTSGSPVGQHVLLNGQRYLVAGVLNSKGGSMGQNMDDSVILPYTTAQRLLQTTYITQFYAQADSTADVNFAVNGISRLLAETYSSTDDYTVINQQDIMNAVGSVTGTLTMLLAGIASISLLVGGIGIMNIMLVSVTERTREIGIRKAIGAKNRDILLQFLFESSVLSALGGLLGVALGVFAAHLYAYFTSGTVLYSPAIIVFAFLFSAAVGIIFGVFPAYKASRLSPIDALRSE